MKLTYDAVVIGGGPAGMAAALESAKTGAKTLLIERQEKLGGILNQCIHNGFGLHFFKEELTGPEYARKFIDLINKSSVDVSINSFVTKIGKNKVTFINPKGLYIVSAKSIVLSMGCRERTAANILLTGKRPVGVYTAGQAQKMINFHGKLPGKNVVILGSGDIGLIMARRLTFEGAKVLKVFEIMEKSSGLRRNISQCLEDFDIPLELSTTVTKVVGDKRIEGVYYAKVDCKLQVIEGTEKYLPCDCLLLSVGLTPETDLVRNIKLNPVTKGAIVDEYLQTSTPGMFACGNVLHVHDLVDNASNESMQAGKFAGLYAKNVLEFGTKCNILPLKGIRYCVPNYFYLCQKELTIRMRVDKRIEKQNIIVKCNDKQVGKKFINAIEPSEMLTMDLDKTLIDGDITVEVE